MAHPIRTRILVVNDDRRLTASVDRLLRDEGYDVTLAYDGKEGLEVLERWPADLVVLDLIMPVLDGWGFLEQLSARADATRPVVLVWSIVHGEGLTRARLLGATECLARQSTGPDSLLQAIARLLARRPHRLTAECSVATSERVRNCGGATPSASPPAEATSRTLRPVPPRYAR